MPWGAEGLVLGGKGILQGQYYVLLFLQSGPGKPQQLPGCWVLTPDCRASESWESQVMRVPGEAPLSGRIQVGTGTEDLAYVGWPGSQGGV